MEQQYIQKLSLKHWADDDKPREKLTTKGRQSLSDSEIIAIIIGSGNTEQSAVELSKTILASCQNNLNELGKLSISDLCRFKGIGEAKAISLIAAIELGRRRSETMPVDKTRILSSKDAYIELAPTLCDLPHEEFWMLLLNRGNGIEDKLLISRGGISSTVVDARLIFKPAIDKLATGIILAHNHPSGITKPSPQDLELTKRLKDAGKTLDIEVIDHLIIAGKTYYSFADEGRL